jgi:large subunit ribosomal protein L30
MKDEEMTNTTAVGSGRIRVTLVRSTIGFDKRQAEVVRGLGLRRLHHTVELQDVSSIRGMLHKVRHLVRVTEVEGEQ